MKFNGKALSSEQLLAALRQKFGAENVNLNSQTGYFEIQTNKDAVAGTADHKNWKFTVFEKEQIPILRNFLPEELLRSMN